MVTLSKQNNFRTLEERVKDFFKGVRKINTAEQASDYRYSYIFIGTAGLGAALLGLYRAPFMWPLTAFMSLLSIDFYVRAIKITRDLAANKYAHETQQDITKHNRQMAMAYGVGGAALAIMTVGLKDMIDYFAAQSLSPPADRFLPEIGFLGVVSAAALSLACYYYQQHISNVKQNG